MVFHERNGVIFSLEGKKAAKKVNNWSADKKKNTRVMEAKNQNMENEKESIHGVTGVELDAVSGRAGGGIGVETGFGINRKATRSSTSRSVPRKGGMGARN